MAETSSAKPGSPGKRRDGVSEVRRGLLHIDLNAAPPEDSGSESPLAAVGLEFGENRGAIGANFAKGKTAEGGRAIAVAGHGKGKEKEEGEGNNTRYWDALLEAASDALREYEEEKAGNRKRRPGREAESREEAARARARNKVNNGRGLVERWNDAAAPVVRSTRRRAVAMPSKYKDSVLHAAAVVVAEARCSRRRPG